MKDLTALEVIETINNSQEEGVGRKREVKLPHSGVSSLRLVTTLEETERSY